MCLGAFASFDEKHTSELLIQILKASVSFSGVSPAVPALQSLYFSGTAIYENDVTAAINHCEEMGYEEHDIIIDTVMSYPPLLAPYDVETANSFGIMHQSSVLWKYYHSMYGVMRAKVAHSNVNFRHVIGPTYELPNKIIPI